MQDPIEAAFEELCRDFGISYAKPDQLPGGGRLDFYLMDFNLLVEVKAWPCDRLNAQLESVNAGPNPVMVLFGLGAVKSLRKLLTHTETLG